MNVRKHLDPEITLLMEMVLVAIKDVLSNVVVQDVDDFLVDFGEGFLTTFRCVTIVEPRASRSLKTKMSYWAIGMRSTVKIHK